MTSNESLRNYILQKIIKRVHLNKKTLSFVEDQTELSDELLGTLIKECAKYGFKESDARTFITQTAENITYNPSILKIHQSLTVDEIEVGQHLSLFFRNKIQGLLSMDLVCLEQNCFFVIKSSIPGLIPLDIVNSMQTDWNMGFSVRFRVERNGKQYPNKNSFLQIGTLESINMYQPSYINKLFDSEDDYTYEGYLLKSHATGNKYVNSYQLKDGRFVFTASNEDDIPKDSLFIICPNEDKDTATLLLNTDYINDTLKNGDNSFISNVLGCCELSNAVTQGSLIVKVIMEEPGVLQCNDLSASEAFWFITAKPIISFC